MKQIVLFGVSFIITMLVTELFIRSTRLGSVSSTEFYEDIGRGRRRDLKYLYFNEGLGIGVFNKYRYIGEAIGPEKEQGTIRIVLLGDSYVESFQVFNRHYFGNIAEDYLSARFPDTKFEILNFGRSGFDIGNMYAYHKTFASQFNPDYVVYMLSNADLDPRRSDPLRPMTVLENDSLLVSLDFAESEIQRFNKTKILTQSLCVLNMLNNCRKKAAITPAYSIFLGKVYTWFNPVEDDVENEVVLNSNFKMSPVTEAIIETLDPREAMFINRDNYRLPSEFIEFCESKDIEFFDLSETFGQMQEHDINPNYWKVTKKTGHWNIEAHDYIGKSVGVWLAEIMEEYAVIDNQ